MNLLLVREIRPDAELPDFGPEFLQHMAGKTHPEGRLASLNAWALLAESLKELGEGLHSVSFTDTGKPYFTVSPLQFSLSHSGNLAAALIADSPCGVDIEQIRPVSDKLLQRCMHPDEIAAGMDFFEAWTKKECLAKLDGSGMKSRPSESCTLEIQGWHTLSLKDGAGNVYRLSAICACGEGIHLEIPDMKTGL